MSTFLELCVKTRQNCRIPGSGPTAVTGQEGELKDIVDWVADAWVDIQNSLNSWRWEQHPFTVNTVASTDTYAYGSVTDSEDSAAITRFGHWILNDFRSPPKIYLTSADVGTQRWLSWLPWEEFELIYRIGNIPDGDPAFISVDPLDRLVIGPPPNDVYTLTGNYMMAAQVLAADGDIPDMPPQFHDLIMYRAMEKYAYTESSEEILLRAQKESKRLMRHLRANQAGNIRLGSPLA